MENQSFNVQVTSTSTIFPSTPQNDPKSVPLSIMDNACANFARCAAIWYYDPPSTPDLALTSSHLQSSLSKTLESYRPWCGRLSYATAKTDGNHNERYRRIWVTYNTETDIGIPFLTAISAKRLSEFLPSAEARRKEKAWDASKLPTKDLLPATKLAISSEKDAPNVIVQFTTFACGSTAIAIEITHCLADAISLSQFAKDWSATSRAMLTTETLPVLAPVFNPQLLDAAAGGNIDISTADHNLISQARKLPQHRYSWYTPTSDQAWPPSIPSDFDTIVPLSSSTPIPWYQWNTSLPVSHYVFHFTPSLIRNIYAAATSPEIKISKHDALLAHIWSRINIARQIPIDTTVYLDITLGLRSRLSPPLPDSFLGSPITHAAIPFLIPSPSSPKTQLSTLASSIRKYLSLFTPAALSNHLHDMAYEYSPQRLWRACLGTEHVLLTTWIHSGVRDVFFSVNGGGLRYIEAVMPKMDGLVEIMEGIRGVGNGEEGWERDGVDVTVFLEGGAMERLRRDKGLWDYTE